MNQKTFKTFKILVIKKKIIAAAILIVLTAAIIIPGFDNTLAIRRYELDTDKISGGISIALISDLHSCRYGEKYHVLVEAVCSENPDLVVLAGDIFDDKLADGNADDFLREISAVYPCYYVTGNHEYWSGESAFSEKMSIIEKYGIKRLSNGFDTIELNGQTFNICGVDDPDAYNALSYDNAEAEAKAENEFAGKIDFVKSLVNDSENFTVLISHRPEFFELYAQHGFDLVLCGHAHGGQWRIPGIVNGLYAPNQGFFPKYAGGLYVLGETTMIVSRGLARETTKIPRFYNPPELVIIDLNKKL